MKNTYKIALTGGIGSGKTAALEILGELGYKTVSCDEITAELYKKRYILKKLKKVFPTAISGKFFYKADKKEIAKLCFNDKQNYAFLTEFLTSETYRRAMKKANSFSGKVVVEVPLLLENGLQKDFDKVIVITRDLAARIESVKKRSSLTQEQITERINNQFDYEKGDLSPYTVIVNDGDKEDLKQKLLTALK